MNRYALVDKRGKNRGTCSARHIFSATGKFVAYVRHGKEIPEGWRVVLREGEEPAIPATKQARKAPKVVEAVAAIFKAGERVRRKAPGTEGVPEGSLGTVGDISASGHVFIKWDNGFAPGTFGKGDSYSPEHQVKLLERVKQEVAGEISVNITVKDLPAVKELLERSTQVMKGQREMIDKLVSEVAALRLERIELTLAAESAKFYASKLDDINSLVRTWGILGATSIPTILYGLKRVLDRKQEG